MRPNDPIADLLTRIRNAIKAEQRFVDIPLSKIKLSIVTVLKDEGYIRSFMVRDQGPQGFVRVFLKYGAGRTSVIQKIARDSTPGRRHYVGHKNIPRVLGGMGIAILSTPKGVMTGDKARAEKVGGELLCQVS
jgi:small subunit ribosomal protein S8